MLVLFASCHCVEVFHCVGYRLKRFYLLIKALGQFLHQHPIHGSLKVKWHDHFLSVLLNLVDTPALLEYFDRFPPNIEATVSVLLLFYCLWVELFLHLETNTTIKQPNLQAKYPYSFLSLYSISILPSQNNTVFASQQNLL